MSDPTQTPDQTPPPALAEGDRWLSEEEAAETIGLSYGRLKHRRLYGGGDKPAHYDFRPGIQYRLSDCTAWLKDRRVDGAP